jgi:hypothetical protein
MSDYFNGTRTIGFTCDNCGRELLGCTWVNGMKFCAKCYQETFGNSTSQFVDLLNKEMYELKIADLEAKLAESETRIEELESQFAYECECNKQFIECQNENTQLKQQLAEKEEFLKKQKELFETVDRELYLTKDTLKHHTNIYNSLVKSRNQDKISLCIEKLEKVKEKMRQNITIAAPVNELKKLSDYLIGVDDYIDNQIKQLKEMK